MRKKNTLKQSTLKTVRFTSNPVQEDQALTKGLALSS